jgi:plasmid stabilization system protein ParE
LTTLILAPEIAEDLLRIAEHLAAHEVSDIEGRLAEIFGALEILLRHPLIGRPAAAGHRELVIGRGSRGYVARYRYDPLEGEVIVMALRAQREAGFRER